MTVGVCNMNSFYFSASRNRVC